MFNDIDKVDPMYLLVIKCTQVYLNALKYLK